MRRNPKISTSDSPRVVNNVLREEWGIGLFRFAQVFAVSPADQIILRNDYPFSSRELEVIKRDLAIMQNTLIKRGRSIADITNRLSDQQNKAMSDEELIKHMRLERFFGEYVRNHEKAISYSSKMSLQGKRGGGINQKSIIAVGWGNLISGKSKRMDWAMLGDLYYWLWARVASYRHYIKLKPSEGIEEYLRHQYIRHKWTGGQPLEHAGLKNFRDVIRTIGVVVSHQFIGGREEFLEKKLALSSSEFPKFFMNLFIDYYLAGSEGLTLFAKDQALADPGYKFLDLQQGKKVGNKLFFRSLEWMFPRGEEYPQIAELPFKGTEISEYLSYAVRLYIEHGIKLRHPRPLIIFPDRSFFSSSF